MRITTLMSALTLSFFLLAGNYVFSQPISTFPYVENFDMFPASLPGSGAITEPNPSAFPGDWGNVNSTEITPDDDGAQDWAAVSGGTPSGATGPTGDHTGNGQYLYIEDSGADNDTISMLSPIFNVSSLTSPYLSIWVHSNVNEAGKFYGGDTSYNDLKIEVFTSGSWVVMDSIGALNSGWTEFLYDLDSYANIIRFRFRANNNNLGDFVHDIAIDDFKVFDFPDIEAELVEARISLNAPVGYQIAPLSQGASYDVSAVIRNNGKDPLTNLKVVADFGTYKDSSTAASLTSLTNDTLSFSSSFTPTDATPGNFTLTLTENDTTPANNMQMVGVNDTTYARDDGASSGSLGFTGGTGIFGNRFTLTTADVLTSGSFFLDAPTVGDSTRILLYSSSTQIPGEPDTLGGLLDSSDYFIIAGGGWITLPFHCQPELAAGDYFIAVEQVNLNNISCGYDSDTYIPGVAFFGDGITRWVEIGAVPSLVSSFMVRMNFGAETAPKANIVPSASALCVGDTVTLNAPAGLNYTWIGIGVQSPMASSTQAVSVIAGTFPYLLQATDANGCASNAITMITYDPAPTATISGDTTICAGESVSLTASGGTATSWNTGDQTAMISVNPTDTTTYTATVLNGGCGVDAMVTVNVPEVSVFVGNETDVACNGDSTGAIDVSSTTPGAANYSWDDGGMGASRTGLPAGTYIVTVMDTGTMCTAVATATIVEPTAIALTASAFGSTNGNMDGFAIVDASGGTAPFTYAWNDAGMQTADTAVNLGPGTYTVIVTDDNGCIDSSSVTIDEYGVGIDDLLNPALVKVYPNPSNGQFVLSGLDAFGLESLLQVAVYDLSGKRIFSQDVHAQNELQINLPGNRAAGVYMVHVQNENMKLIKRVMIK